MELNKLTNTHIKEKKKKLGKIYIYTHNTIYAIYQIKAIKVDTKIDHGEKLKFCLVGG